MGGSRSRATARAVTLRHFRQFAADLGVLRGADARTYETNPGAGLLYQWGVIAPRCASPDRHRAGTAPSRPAAWSAGHRISDRAVPRPLRAGVVPAVSDAVRTYWRGSEMAAEIWTPAS